MPVSDNIQGQFEVGMIVNIPCVVTGISGSTQPALTLTTVYPGFAGTKDDITGIDSVQVIVGK